MSTRYEFPKAYEYGFKKVYMKFQKVNDLAQ